MINNVDDDQSGQIEFPEFLQIIKAEDGDANAGNIKTFFKDFSNGKLGKKELSFPVFVN